MRIVGFNGTFRREREALTLTEGCRAPEPQELSGRDRSQDVPGLPAGGWVMSVIGPPSAVPPSRVAEYEADGMMSRFSGGGFEVAWPSSVEPQLFMASTGIHEAILDEALASRHGGVRLSHRASADGASLVVIAFPGREAGTAWSGAAAQALYDALLKSGDWRERSPREDGWLDAVQQGLVLDLDHPGLEAMATAKRLADLPAATSTERYVRFLHVAEITLSRDQLLAEPQGRERTRERVLAFREALYARLADLDRSDLAEQIRLAIPMLKRWEE